MSAPERAPAAVRVRPITDGDRAEVAEFLAAQLNPDLTAGHWRAALDNDWDPDRPNHGVMLVDDLGIAGVYLAFYSRRERGGRVERFCNLGAWCVRPDRRLHAPRLLRALLAQNGFHFLDLSPSGSVVAMNERLGFRHVDTATALVPTLPLPWGGPLGTVTGDPARIRAALSGAELARYLDHAAAPAARHLLLRRGGRSSHVMFRMDRRRGLPRVFATLLHVGDPELFHELLGPLRGHLLVRHRALAILAELRLVGRRPRGSTAVSRPRPRMVRSVTLPPAEVDYFYSELVSVPW
ncbi:MAG: hypothetical protein ACT4RN_19870 [Pseudonocardia sp.]